jgi:DNA-directed RNA polymerase subunit RPC12/RpoP
MKKLTHKEKARKCGYRIWTPGKTGEFGYYVCNNCGYRIWTPGKTGEFGYYVCNNLKHPYKLKHPGDTVFCWAKGCPV